jgi:hypothetical protein
MPDGIHDGSRQSIAAFGLRGDRTVADISDLPYRDHRSTDMHQHLVDVSV